MNILNVTIQNMKRTEATLRHIITTRITGANRAERLVEAKRLLLEKRERVAALRQLIATMDAASFASCGAEAGSRNVAEYRAQLVFEQTGLDRLENVMAIFDELLQE